MCIRDRKWASILVGGLVCTREHAVSGGLKGPAVAFKRALDVTRFVWLSPGFQHACPRTSALLKLAIGTLPSKWTLYDDRTKFLDKAFAQARSKKDATMLALVSADEQRHDPDAGLKCLSQKEQRGEWEGE
eukprot:5466268-Pyramimonas_sp.AAC.1